MNSDTLHTLLIAAFLTVAISAVGSGKAGAVGDAHHEHETHGDAAREDRDAHQDGGHEEDGHAGHAHGENDDPDAFCGEHRIFEREDALCQAPRIAELEPGEGLMVRLAARDAAEKVGIAVATPQTMSMSPGVLLPGRSEFNRNRTARLTALGGGVVLWLGGEIGQRVAKGQVLAEIAIPEGVAVRGQYRSALARETQTEAAWIRERDLHGKGISSRLEYEQAEAEYRATRSEVEQLREQLTNYGIAEEGTAQARLHAPLAGVIVEKGVGIGDLVAPGTHLFTIADPGLLWVDLSVPESRITIVSVGTAVEARFDGLPGTVFGGRIVLVGAAVDERTQTLKAVAEIANPGGNLKAGMFGQVKVIGAPGGETLAVPVSAVQSIDHRNFIFVRKEPDLFEIRRVETGAKSRDMVGIAFGLERDEEVVVAQGFALKSEVLKARLGASCADH